MMNLLQLILKNTCVNLSTSTFTTSLSCIYLNKKIRLSYYRTSLNFKIKKDSLTDIFK